MNTFKITRQIDENHFEIEVKWDKVKYFREIDFRIQHDYIGIMEDNFISTKDSSVKLFANNTVANGISLASYVQVPIRDFVNFCLPLIKKSEYCTEKHIKDNYVHIGCIIYFYDNKSKCQKVAVRLAGEEEYTIVTHLFFEKFIKPALENESLL